MYIRVSRMQLVWFAAKTRKLSYQHLFTQGFFLEMLFWGRNSFCGERKCEKYPKNITKFVTVWGGNSKLKGGNFPPKGPEKKTRSSPKSSLSKRQWNNSVHQTIATRERANMHHVQKKFSEIKRLHPPSRIYQRVIYLRQHPCGDGGMARIG